MIGRKLDNWIKAYLAFTAESESPEEFHKWVALSVIAGAVRRKAYFDMGYFKVWTNMYIVLVAPAGRCKKSTAMRIGRAMLTGIPGVQFSTDSVSRERLILDLSQTFSDGHSSMTAFSTEFASLLTTSGMDMVVFLTDIYDSPDEWAHKTKSGGTNKITSPYLNLLGATTPDWIAKAMPLDTVGIGLTSRIVFVYQDTPRVRPPFPRLTPEQQELGKLLVEDLAAISTTSGEYLMTPGAISFYEEWYKDRIENPNTTGDPRLNGYFERKPIHLIKVAMLIAASFRDELLIKEEDLRMALGLFGEVEEPMVRVFANVGKNPLSIDMDDIAAVVLGSHEGCTRGELLRMFKHSVRKEELEEVLSSLTEMGIIKLLPGGKYVGNV